MSSNIVNITSHKGLYVMTDASGNKTTMDLATMMMLLNIDMTETYDNQISARMLDMQTRSNNMKKMTEALNLLRGESAKTEYLDSAVVRRAENLLAECGVTSITRIASDTGGWAENVCKADKKTGDVTLVKAALETMIENVKSVLETMGNDSQLENIKLQNVMQKRSNSFEMTTKIMDSNKQTLESIIRNL